MASQYDNIGSKYEGFKALPTSIIEEANFKESIEPWLAKFPNASVLDLACGTGYYSKKLLDWGAGYVLGIDASSGMVDVAKESMRKDQAYIGKVDFKVGNALALGDMGGDGPFQIVVGIWLLNYASNLEEMTSMYRTISTNLKDGGVFIVITPPPADNVDTLAENWTKITAQYLKALPVWVNYYEKLESGQGWKTEINSLTKGMQFSFRNFHLVKSLYEEAARSGGLEGNLEWKEINIPERVATAQDELSKMCVQIRHMGVLAVEKKGA
ncbi:hypothetical protein J7T55_015651 [Diaporthe amygdali]|uniref:uncharacterized protein n=1 Tax=Phomopsis amygdali TaxID=1214568 RepID=UPI0022FDD51D|nr:uncharacterized protein J7T55_015651 [Diaporthe amygdali]KAJ0120913.1 hypothetical protein J7T55_015651 [Diaporthe amygdali]